MLISLGFILVSLQFLFAFFLPFLATSLGLLRSQQSLAFEDPMILALLFLLPPLLFWKKEKLFTPAFSFPLPHKSVGKVGFRVKIRKLHPLLFLLGLGFLIIGLARPQLGHRNIEVTTEGVDIFLGIDTSGSMQALDFQLNNQPTDRLSVVKKVVKEFVKKRPSDRLGMVIFADMAITQCPLTQDHGVLLSFLDRTQIGMVGQATAIGSAIGVAVNRLKDLKAKSRILILLTDGSSNAGEITPEKASELAKKYGVKIYTVGIGSNGQAPFLVRNPFFGDRYIYQQVEMDEATLKNIAKATGGTYFNARNTEDLEKIYLEIDQLEKTDARVKKYMSYQEFFTPFVLFGLLLLFLFYLMETVIFPILPVQL